MAEKKSRKSVVAKTSKKGAKGKRIAALVLWVFALVAEVLTFLILKGTWYIPTDKIADLDLYFMIGFLALDLILVVIGSLLWKKANHVDPISKENKFKFFIWNQMGLIVAIICFLPIVIILLMDKDLDKNQKKIVSIVAAVALVIASLFSIDYNPVSAEEIAEQQKNLTGTVYWTQFGKSYHLDPDCPSLQRSKSVYEGTIEEAFEAKRTDPCDFCAVEKTK